MDVLLGIDVGTTSVKGLAVSAEGYVQAYSSQSLAFYTPHATWVEQDPEQIWQAVILVCRQVASQLQGEGQIHAISLSSQGGTTIPVDAAGRPTHLAFSWMDERASQEAYEAGEALGCEWIRTTTGWPLSNGNPLNHIAWFRKHCPGEFRQTKRFLFVNDLVSERLCGEACMDPSNASITQLYNLSMGGWEERLLGQAGIRPEQLSPILPSGKVIGQLSSQASEQIGLPSGIPVINGAHDQYCAAVGTGVTRPGPILLSCGTAWVVLAVPISPQQALQGGMSVSRHAIQGLWGAIRSLGGVGVSVEWLLDQFWREEGDRLNQLRAYNQAAADSPPGAHGLIFTPLSGGHAGTDAPANRGLVGLVLGHTRGDIARALMEGIALELRWMFDQITEAVPVKMVRMIGGAARSPLWPQIVADTTRLPVELPEINEAASLGAALLAGTGVGWFPDAQSAYHSLALPSQSVLPQHCLEEFATQLYARYQKMWNLLVYCEDERSGGVDET